MSKKKTNNKIPHSLELQAQPYISLMNSRKRARRITSIAMAVFMFFTTMLTTFAVSQNNVLLALENGPSAGVSDRVSDADTMDTYIDRLISRETGSRYSGRLWADKSVFSNGSSVTLDMETDGYNGTISSNADFLHAFSALGSSQMVSSNDPTPLDVVFILDISGSMTETEANFTDPNDVKINNTKIVNAINELNNAMRLLMGYDEDFETSPYNRIGLVTFSDAIGDFSLPLDRYYPDTENGKETYFEIPSSVTSVYNMWFEAQGFKNSNDEVYKCETTGNAEDPNRVRVAGQTYTQGGFYAGMSMLAEEESTYIIVDSEGNYVSDKGTPGVGQRRIQRQPVIILLSDGEPNQILENEDDGWWKNLRETPTNFYSTGQNIGGIVGGVGFMTMATASYWKQQINKNYFGATEPGDDSRALVYNVGLKIASNQGTGYLSGDLAQIVLNPEFMDTDLSSSPVAERIKTYWDNYNDPMQESFAVALGKTADFTARDVTYEFRHPEEDDIKTLYYVDGYTPVENNADLAGVFTEIIKEISIEGQVFRPLSGTNGAGVEDSLTYADPIGEYMEIKDGAIVNGGNTADMSMLLLGRMYDLEKTGIYDYNFNLKYKETHPAEYPGYPDVYAILKDGWYSSDDPETAQYLGDSDEYSWEDGYFRYVSYETAIDYVPTLAELTDSNGDGTINGFDATEKQQNTVYSLYRIIEADEIGDVWRFNPAYEGRIPELNTSDYDNNFILNETRQNEYTELAQAGQSVPGGVYRLNDIRIWIEDTGDFKDKYPDDTLFVGMGYDQALYVNVPSGALPIQVAEILLDSAGVASYVTNLGAEHEGDNQDFYYQQSTPLRVFYSVGLQKEIVTADGVDLTKVSQTYLDSHRNDDNSVYFLSNYFTGDGNEEYKDHGDPVITFSPGISNRFYVFQKTLAFYTKAYRWNGNGFVEVTDITNWEGGELKGIFETVAEAGTEGYDHNDIIFLSDDVADTKIESNGTYFWTFECYVSDGSEARVQVREDATGGRTVNYVLARKGSDFIAKDFDNLREHDMLNWYDLETGATQPYNDGNKPDTEGTWVLATHVGGLRLSELASFEKNNNVTQTADYYYTPAVSGSSGSGADVLINAYLGNNGRITIEDTLLLVTKFVEPQANSQLTSSQLKNEEFNYQIYIEDFAGIHSAIRVQWDETAQLWWRKLSTIDVLTSNEGLLQDTSFNPVTVNENGESDPEGGYYVYVPSIGEDDSSDNVSRVFSADENGESVNGSARRNTDQSNQSIDFLADTVYLVPVELVVEGWSFPENAPEGDGIKKIENSFVIANMEGSSIYDRTSGYGPTSSFAIRARYFTVDLVFGVNYTNEDGEEITDVDFKAPTELYDESSFNGGSQNDEDVDVDTIALHTAQFTLKHGEGLLFNSIQSGGDYRVTEKLPQNQVKEGWSLWNQNERVTKENYNDTLKVAVHHIQQNSYTNYDDSGEPTDVWSNAGGGTIWTKENGQFVSPGGDVLQTATNFNVEDHTYSVFGDTALQEEAVQYTNTIVPAAMEISKVVVGDHNDGDVYTFNIEYYAIGENGDEIPLSDGKYHAYIHATDHECSLENHPHVEGETTGNCENDLLLTDGKGSVVLKDGETYVICGLPQGTYYKITESIEIKDGMVYDYVTGFDITDDAGSRHVNGLTATGYLNTADENDTVKVVRVAYTNRAVLPEPGDLTVSKTVGGFGATGKDKEWHFTITLTPPDPEHFDTTYDFVGGVLDGITGVTPPNDGRLTFTKQENGTYTAQITLKHGQTITLKDLPYGTDYSVSENEANQGGYTTTVTGDADGTINFDREVGFVNTPYGSLEVEKEVVGEDPDSKEFNFTVTLIGEGLDPKKLEVSGDSDITWTVDGDGTLKGTFTLSDGQSIIISNIPADATYKVEEEKLNDYAVEKSGDTGTIKAGETATAHFINMLVYDFPELGGIGTLPFQLPGIALITIALLCVILMKKRHAKTAKS